MVKCGNTEKSAHPLFVRVVRCSTHGCSTFLLLTDLFSCQAVHAPPAENAWWFDLSFLSQTPFLIWNVRWAIKLQNAQLQVVHHWSAKWPPQFLFRDLHFLCERESSVYQHSVLLKTGPQLTYCRTSSSGLQVRVSEVVLHSQTLTGRSLAMWDYFTSDTLHS